MRVKSIAIFALIVLFFASNLSACTGILLKAKDGAAVSGRTVEFAVKLDMSVAVVPRNFKFVGNVPHGKGMEYRSKYASVGVYCFDAKVLMDGMNEKGLVAAAFYFPGYAKYTPITEKNRSNALSPVDFTNWILTQFATIEEVKAALPSVVIAPSILNGWGSAPPPMHYIVSDKDGKSIVIEPVNGTLVVHENLLGTITNSPTFDWQLTNLRNYINLSPYNVDPIDLKGIELAPFGQGSGMVGLPGDFTPPSRFVRAALFSAAAIPTETSEETVNQVFHILNQFDIPAGSVAEKGQGKTTFDTTMLTSVKDIRKMKYFYKSYDDQTIKFVDLSQFDPNAKTIKSMQIEGAQKGLDISSSLQ